MEATVSLCNVCDLVFRAHTHPHSQIHTPRVITEELHASCVTVFTRLGLALAQEPDEYGLSGASLSL